MHLFLAQVGGRPPDHAALKPVWLLSFTKRVRECALSGAGRSSGSTRWCSSSTAIQAPLAVEPLPAPRLPLPRRISSPFQRWNKWSSSFDTLPDLAALDRPLAASFPAAALYSSMLLVTFAPRLMLARWGLLFSCVSRPYHSTWPTR